METLDEVAVFADTFKYVETDAGHDEHIEHNIDRVGQLDAVLCEIGANDTHGVGNDVHGFALHGALVELGELFVAFLRIHPVVDVACFFFGGGADIGSVFHTRDIVYGGAVQIAVGKQFFV